jgi:hypothetical protein
LPNGDDSECNSNYRQDNFGISINQHLEASPIDKLNYLKKAIRGRSKVNLEECKKPSFRPALLPMNAPDQARGVPN